MVSKTNIDIDDLIIISAPSGGGKNTLINMLLENHSQFSHSISTTTRHPRSREQNGVHYYFVNKSEFEDLIVLDAFIEYEVVLKNYYGTTKHEIERLQKANKRPILDLDVKGALYLKSKYPNITAIFIMPPSIDILRKRLMNRATENVDEISSRLKLAEEELKHRDEFDQLVVNDDLETSYEQLQSLLVR